jgi:hypothetical protein
MTDLILLLTLLFGGTVAPADDPCADPTSSFCIFQQGNGGGQ